MWLCTGHHPRLAPCGSYQTPAAWRGCIPMNLQEGDVAVYWPSPAARAMRLTTRGLRHAAHIRRLRRGAVAFQ